MRLLWVLMTTIVVVWAVPASPVTKADLNQLLSSGDETSRNNIIENLLLSLIETLRTIIVEGSGAIPPLDPLQISNVELNDSILPLPGARLSLNDVTVSNLGTFEVDRLSATLTSLLQQRYRILLDAHIPALEATADQYEISLSALGYNVYGAGALKVRLVEPKIRTDLLVGLRLSGGIFLNILECNIQFDLAGFEPEITGIFNNELASNFVNLFLKDLLPSLVDAYQAEITEFLSTNVYRIGNEILADLDLTDLI